MDEHSATDHPPSRWPRGLGLFWYGPLVVLVLLTLYTTSVPMGYFLPMMALMFAWPAFGLVTVTWYAVSAARRRTFRPKAVHWVPVVTVAVTAAAVLLNVPMLARYAASRPAMDGFVEDAMRDPKSVEKRDRIGLWAVERPQAYKGGARFIVRDTGFLDLGGLAYSKDGPPPNLGGEDYYDHLHGDWYIWHESW